LVNFEFEIKKDWGLNKIFGAGYAVCDPGKNLTPTALQVSGWGGLRSYAGSAVMQFCKFRLHDCKTA